MKVRIDSSRTLADTVGWVAKNLPGRPSVPVLAGIKLTAARQLTVEGFDYEVSTQTHVPAVVDEPGTVLVSGRLLAEITKALPGKPVDITAVGAHVELVCGSARFTLPTMPVEDYPTLPAMPATVGTVDGAAFAAAVQQVTVAAGRDETLPMMTGVRLEMSGDTMTMLATDRYRLAWRDLPWTPADPDIDRVVLVPASILADVAKAAAGADTVTVALADPTAGEGIIGISAAGRRTTSRLLDGANYPPVKTLFPVEFGATATVQVAALTEVVRRVALVADRATPVRLTWAADDSLLVEAGGTEDARASEAMDATFTGEPLTIAFNPQYLLDGLAAVGGSTARLDIVDAFKPAVLSPVVDGDAVPGYRYLAMPIRVAR